MSQGEQAQGEQAQRGAHLFDLGYRRYEGERGHPFQAVLTLAVFTARRVLGLGRGARHKVLPAITLAVAFVPALISVGVSIFIEGIVSGDLISYGEYQFFIGSALIMFTSLIAPEALCPDRRSGMLGLYLAGPLDRTRYLAAKWAAVFGVMLLITIGPLLFMLLANVVAGFGPSASEAPGLLLRIAASGVVIALLYASISLAVSSFTTRRAAAAVATVLLLLLPPIFVRSAIDGADAPKALDLLSFPFVAADASVRIFGETPEEIEPVHELSAWLVAGGLAAAIAAGLLICWLRYRRMESFR